MNTTFSKYISAYKYVSPSLLLYSEDKSSLAKKLITTSRVDFFPLEATPQKHYFSWMTNFLVKKPQTSSLIINNLGCFFILWAIFMIHKSNFM